MFSGRIECQPDSTGVLSSGVFFVGVCVCLSNYKPAELLNGRSDFYCCPGDDRIVNLHVDTIGPRRRGMFKRMLTTALNLLDFFIIEK